MRYEYIIFDVYGAIPMQQDNTKTDFGPSSHQPDGTLLHSSCSTPSPATPPSQDSLQKGQSVEYALNWFTIRATHSRAQKVYNALLEVVGSNPLFQSCELYLPLVAIKHIDKSDEDKPKLVIVKQPLDNGLLFVHCTNEQFREMIKLPIAGLTPYYDHTRQTEYGRNPYLVVPDDQFSSFRTIIDSELDDIIINQSNLPTLFKGDKVRVTDGPFAGVQGYVLKYKHQLRVFVQVNCLGTFATAYVPRVFLEKLP